MVTTDVRALLRAERASRRITHPHASYTSDGKLLCNLCDTLVKNEAQWQNHLHSTRHRERSQTAGKKRKAESPPVEEIQDESERKRTRSEEEEDSENGNGKLSARPVKAVKIQDEPTIIEETTAPPISRDEQPTTLQTDAVDEAELAAFERELAELEAESEAASANPGISALTAEATITAAPMTAEQLAVQAREEQSAQRGRRDVELEAEKEDAARVLEDEFEEMEGLEARVRKLRERREALRDAGPVDEGGGVAGPAEDGVEVDGTAEIDEDGSEEDDEDDFDEWKFGGS